MASKTYDAIVIGGGPGGYVAAIRLGQLGLKPLVVEKETMGGVCLNWGCIPSKALIAAGSLVDKIRRADKMGITVSDVSVDVGKLQDWKNGIVKKLTGGVSMLVKANGGEVMLGTAQVTGAKTVEVTAADGSKETVTASRAIIVATGTSVIEIPGFEPEGDLVITAREGVSLQRVPEHLILIGGGVIGLELGMVYQKLGSKITIVEMADGVLQGVDRDLVKVVERHLKKAGATTHTNARATKLERSGGKATLHVDKGGETIQIEGDCVLVAVGFRPNGKNIGLEGLGVAFDQRGHITVDDKMETNVPGIYAIGDVCGGPYLAHKASKEGEIAAEVIAGHKAARDWRAMPAAIFTDPEIATAGLSEMEAKEQGKKVKIGKFPFAASGRAMAVSETDGFIKVISDADSHEVLGVGIVGPEASDLISEAALAIEMCAFTEDVALTVHPHPTLGEGMMEAFKHALGEAIHILNK